MSQAGEFDFLERVRSFNLGYSTSAHQFGIFRIYWVLKSVVGKEISSCGAGRGYGSSRGPPSCDDWCRPWLDAWLLQVLVPSFRHGLNGQALLLSDVVVSFCRDEACGKIKHKVTSGWFQTRLGFPWFYHYLQGIGMITAIANLPRWASWVFWTPSSHQKAGLPDCLFTRTCLREGLGVQPGLD